MYVYEIVKQGRLKALRLGIRAIRTLEQSLNEFVESNIVDPDEYFGFEEALDSDQVCIRQTFRSSLMGK